MSRTPSSTASTSRRWSRRSWTCDTRMARRCGPRMPPATARRGTSSSERARRLQPEALHESVEGSGRSSSPCATSPSRPLLGFAERTSGTRRRGIRSICPRRDTRPARGAPRPRREASLEEVLALVAQSLQRHSIHCGPTARRRSGRDLAELTDECLATAPVLEPGSTLCAERTGPWRYLPENGQHRTSRQTVSAGRVSGLGTWPVRQAAVRHHWCSPALCT
jgi:hypothetical protein